MKMKETVDEEPMTEKSRKEIIDELILNSKKKKFEKAKESEENFQLISQLDEDFKSADIRNMLFGKANAPDLPKAVSSETQTPSSDPKYVDYDKLVKDLHMEAKIELPRPKPAKVVEESDEQKKSKVPVLIGAISHVLGEFKVNSYSCVFRILRLNHFVCEVS